MVDKSHLGTPMTYGFDTGDELPGHNDEKTFEQTSAFITSRKDLNQPFFLWLAPRQPHVPLLPRQKWLDLYPSGSIHLTTNFRVEPRDDSLNNQGTPGMTLYRDSDLYNVEVMSSDHAIVIGRVRPDDWPELNAPEPHKYNAPQTLPLVRFEMKGHGAPPPVRESVGGRNMQASLRVA